MVSYWRKLKLWREIIVWHKNYQDMNWKELVAEGKKRGLDRRLFSIKGMEGAGERDYIEIIRQLNLLDQQKDSRDAKLIALIALIISVLSLIVCLAINVFAQWLQ